MKAYCLFEQSGVFKNAFKKFGIDAYDFDIENQFSQTDFQIDLFEEIEKAYNNEKTIFDNIKTEDIIIAFFPCTYFCENNNLFFTGKHFNQKKLSKTELIRTILERSKSREKFYEKILQLVYIAYSRDLRLIIENPYSSEHYLYNNFPIESIIIDKDRRDRGDLFKKQTQYLFFNCKYGNNITFTNKKIKTRRIESIWGADRISRSLISNEYAENFIADFLAIKQDNKVIQLSLY